MVGAGPAGLACAATMRAKGVSVTVVEKADRVGSAWRRHLQLTPNWRPRAMRK